MIILVQNGVAQIIIHIPPTAQPPSPAPAPSPRSAPSLPPGAPSLITLNATA